MSKRQTKADQFVSDMTRCRGMDWVRLGMMVEVDGHLGTIKGMNSSANLDVEFANQLKWGKGTHNCHPTWETRYFDADGKVIKDFRRVKAVAQGEQAAEKGGDAPALTTCAAGRDGECGHAQCPQLRDNEPNATGRHCPLDNDSQD